MSHQAVKSSSALNFPKADSTNAAGGRAYALEPKHALAQLAVTGTLNGVFYTSAQTQLETLRSLIARVDDNEYLAKLASTRGIVLT